MSAATAVFGYTLRACLPARRRAGLLLLCGAAVVFGLLVHVPSDETPAVMLAQVASFALFTLVLPLASLVAGDAVLGAEIRGGTFAFTWLSPVPFSTIVMGRVAGGTALLWVTLVPAFAAAALVAGVPGAAVPLAAAAAAGTATYVAVFVAVATLFRRATVASLALVFLIERLLGSALSGIAQWSPAWQALSVYTGFTGVSFRGMREGIPTGWSALIRLLLITAIAVVVATARLRRLRLAGATD